MKYKFFTNSEKAWGAMFEAMRNAQKSIYLEMYIFNDDTILFDFLNLLKEKAKNGIRVRMVLDSFGSAGLSNTAINTLRENGAELFFFSSFLHRIHRKILVVDEDVAFIGGVNVHQIAWHWDDLVVRINGKLVLAIIKSFAKVYVECGGKDSQIIIQNKKIILDKTRTWFIEQFPIRKNLGFKKIYKKHLREAEKNIILVTPYFMPKHWFIGILHQAVLRGVKVEVLVPRATNHFIVDRVGYFFMFKLSKLGVNFYLQPKMNHAKAMIIDSKEGIVGSNNLDFLSFELNSEVGIFFKDQHAVLELSEIVKKWKKDATLFNFQDYKPKLFDYILSPIISIFTKIF